MTQQSRGNATGANQHTKETKEDRINDNNVNNYPAPDPQESPTPPRTSPVGTSKDQALRKLRTESEKEQENGTAGRVTELYEQVQKKEIRLQGACPVVGECNRPAICLWPA
jgi:hypothetical protein